MRYRNPETITLLQQKVQCKYFVRLSLWHWFLAVSLACAKFLVTSQSMLMHGQFFWLRNPWHRRPVQLPGGARRPGAVSERASFQFFLLFLVFLNANFHLFQKTPIFLPEPNFEKKWVCQRVGMLAEQADVGQHIGRHRADVVQTSGTSGAGHWAVVGQTSGTLGELLEVET